MTVRRGSAGSVDDRAALNRDNTVAFDDGKKDGARPWTSSSDWELAVSTP
jgi:hypothetical protein